MGCAVGACLGCVVMGVDGTTAGVPRGSGVRAGRDRLGGARVRRKRAVVTSRVALRRPPRIRTPGSGTTVRRPTGGLAAGRCRARPTAGRRSATPLDVDLSIDLAPQRPGALVLRNPMLVASGTFGYGIEYGEVVDIDRLGAICCKGTTLKARAGNPPPRVTETPAGMLNSIGLQNPGVDAVLERYAPRWATWQVPVIVNVAGESVEDYVAVARKLDDQPGVAGIELNISCPNVGKGGLQFALDARAAAEVTAAVRRATDLPLLVKLSPAATDVRGIADGQSRTPAPTPSARSTRCRGWPSTVAGGSRSWATPTAACRVRRSSRSRCASCTRSPRWWTSRSSASAASSELDDVLDFLMAGACAVQVGTALFADPVLPVRLIDELEDVVRATTAWPPIASWSGSPCRPAATGPASRAWSTAVASLRPGHPGRALHGRARDGPRRPSPPRRALRGRAIRGRALRGRLHGRAPAAGAGRVAARTEALFRSSGALRDGHFLLKSGRHGRALPGEVPGAPVPGRGEGAVRLHGRPGPRRRRPTDGRCRRRSDHRRRHPGLRGRRASWACAASSRRRSATPTAPRTASSGAASASTRRAGAARGRHPDHRRLAARDAAGDRGDRRRPGPRYGHRGPLGRPARETARPGVAAATRRPRCGRSTCPPSSRPGHLPGLRSRGRR